MTRTAPLLLLLPLALAACGDNGQPGPKERIGAESARGDVLPVMGREHRVVVMLDATLGNKAQAAFPAMLEAALRARGVNARVSAYDGAAPRGVEPAVDLLVVPAGTSRPAGIRALQFDYRAMLAATPDLMDAHGAATPEGSGELVAQTVEKVANALSTQR